MGVEDRRGALGEGMQRLTVVNRWRTTGGSHGVLLFLVLWLSWPTTTPICSPAALALCHGKECHAKDRLCSLAIRASNIISGAAICRGGTRQGEMSAENISYWSCRYILCTL